ncbi:MAG TPA: hypothetical protein VG298_06215 [Acidimicrobiales bacterium]|nr:hypothetical protein [Acidimicrobiales bacterium]
MKSISRVVATGFATLVTVAGLSVVAGPAFGAGTGYTGGSGGTGGTGATGTNGCVPGTVASAGSVGSAGGTVTATVAGETITLVVPAGEFADGTQIIITNNSSTATSPAAGYTPVLAFGISVCVNGVKNTGTFSAIPVTVTGANIPSSAKLFVLNGTTYVLDAATIGAGTVTFSLTSDPSFEVAVPSAAAASTVIPNSTIVVTGKPFLLEGLIAAVLLMAGVVLLLRLRLRRSY